MSASPPKRRWHNQGLHSTQDDSRIYARIDLGYEKYQIAIEYDGEDFHSTPEQRAHDAARDAQLDDDG